MADRAIYMNNAATAWPRAPGVTDAVAKVLGEIPDHPGRGAVWQSCDPFPDRDPLQACRTHLATLFSVRDANRIVLSPNATSALNLALHGQDWGTCSRVVTTVTEHNSVLRPLAHIRKKHPFYLSVIGLDRSGALDAGAFSEVLEAGADLVVINHASNVTGRIQDVRPLFARAHEQGAVTLLDASQTLGHVPVHPESLGADLVAFTGHKALRGPPGTGGLYVSPAIQLEQVFVGGTGVRSDLELHPPEMPMRLEAGTPNLPAFAGLAAALRWHEGAGRTFQGKEQVIARDLLDGLEGIAGVQVMDPDRQAERVPIISFRIRDWPVGDCGYALANSFGIICRTGLHCAPLIHAAIGSAPEGTIRFSPSGFTTNEEIDSVLDAVKTLADSRGSAGI
jgi:cysteine desulfurase / selenocysteine lyase